MDIHTNIPLKNYLTMKIGGYATYLTEVRTREELEHIIKDAKSKKIPFFVLGGGSNVIAKDEGFKGLVIRMRIPGFEVIADDPSSTIIKVGAGEDWDSVVEKSVQMRLSGIESMSAIPGTAGAAPVQNIGAYGQEVADTLVSLEAYDCENEVFVTLSNEECKFTYRDSIFKSEQFGRYIIVSITLRLLKSLPQPPFYDSLQKYLDERNQTMYTPEIIRNAVIDIRSQKLPDPKISPNSGSFFKNAIVESWQVQTLKDKYPDMPMNEMADGRVKIPTGWLIDKTGLKGATFHGMKISENNALVLINESAKSYADLSSARDEIMIKVRDMFGIQIEQEPIEM